MEKIRIHHLLCLPLFVGEGYSDTFSANMSKVKQMLKEDPDRMLEAVCGPDLICANCPNLQPSGRVRKTDVQTPPGIHSLKPIWGDGKTDALTPRDIYGRESYSPELVCRDEDNHVVEKDRELADWLGIRTGECYTWGELLRLAEERLTEAQFTASCRRCRWYRQGLCSYAAWRNAVFANSARNPANISNSQKVHKKLALTS